MKRDMDLIRTIMQKIEECETPYGLESMPEIESHSGEKISYHIKLLCDADLIDARPIEEFSEYTRFINLNLTCRGQDFLSAASDDTLWSEAKEHIIKPGTSFTFDLLVEWLKAKAKEKIGLP